MRKSIWMFVLALSACALMMATGASAKEKPVPQPFKTTVHSPQGINGNNGSISAREGDERRKGSNEDYLWAKEHLRKSRRSFVEVIDRWLEMYNTANVSKADKIFTPDFVPHFPAVQLVGVVDRASYLAKAVNPGALNTHIVLDDFFGVADEMVGRFTITATWPPNKPYTNTAIVFFRFEDGRIAEEWWEADFMGVLEQAGQLPPTRPAFAYVWSPPSPVKGYPSGAGQNASLACRSVQAANAVNFPLWASMISADYVNHDPVAWYATDRATEAAFMQFMFTAFPDQRFTIEDIVASRDRVALRLTITGTQLGKFGALPATGRQVHWSGMAIFRIADGKIVEGWWSEDVLDLMQQLTAP